jgi:hypothetical protein
MRYQAIAITLMLAMATAGTAIAGDIYKWTDEDGNVHFGDKPIGAQPERLAIQSKPTDPAKIQAMAQSRSQAAAKAAKEAAAAEPEGPSPEELQAEADGRSQKCTTYRAQLQQYVTSRRLYREDESGERVYLDEGEMQAAREQVENRVEEFCSS